MTSGGDLIPTERRLVRVQEKGQVTLPADVRRNLGLKKGDLVAVTSTREGVLITPQKVIATQALDRIGQALKVQGVTLEDLIESGRELRGELIDKQYDLCAKD